MVYKRKDNGKKAIKNKRNGKLSLKEEMFKNEYLFNGFNAKRAYMKAYGETDVNEAAVKGYELLRRSGVMETIDKFLTSTFHKLEVSVELLIASYANQAFHDARSFFDEGDKFIGMRNLNVIQQACIESVETTEFYNKDGERTVKSKVQFYSRKAALDALAKYKGLIKDNDTTNNNTIIFQSNQLVEKLGADRIIELNNMLSK